MKGLALELVHRHLGRAAVVCGGGESLPSQLARCSDNAIYISANQHGCLARRCDYIMVVDGIEDKSFTRPDGTSYGLRDFGVPIISPRPAGDYWLFDQCAPSSGVMAAWMAWIMGCAPILLAGIDCYQGPTYYHDPGAKSSGRALSLQRHLDRWASLLQHAPGGQFRPLGGPLTEIFPAYDPQEAAGEPSRRSLAQRKTSGVWVEFVRSCCELAKPRAFAPGDRVQVSAKLAKRAMLGGFARPLEECAA